MSAAANRGKDAEKAVQSMLKSLGASHKHFCWERHYDAHSAGGRFQKVTGDYGWYHPGIGGMSYNGIIEVKEVKHDTRLPYKNYDAGAVGKVRMRELGGGYVDIFVYHSTSDRWRRVPLSFFLARNGATPSGSWDCSEFPLFNSPMEAFQETWDMVRGKA